MPESYHKLQLKPKTVSEFKDALQLMWSALPEKSINNDCRYCVSANGGHSQHIM